MKKIAIRSMLAGSLAALTVAGCSNDGGETELAQAAAACDRACLIDATESYLGALADGDPSKAPLASQVAFVEYLKRLQVGEGLWQTITGGKTDFSIIVPDPILQQVGWIGVLE